MRRARRVVKLFNVLFGADLHLCTVQAQGSFWRGRPRACRARASVVAAKLSGVRFLPPRPEGENLMVGLQAKSSARCAADVKHKLLGRDVSATLIRAPTTSGPSRSGVRGKWSNDQVEHRISTVPRAPAPTRALDRVLLVARV